MTNRKAMSHNNLKYCSPNKHNVIKFFTIIFLIAHSVSLRGQNYLRPIDSSGVNIDLQYSALSNFNIYGILPSYTINGRIDLGIGYGYQKHKTNSSTTLSNHSYNFSVGYLLLKQGHNNKPINLNIEASYQINNFTDHDDAGKEYKQLLGFSFLRKNSDLFSLLINYEIAYRKPLATNHIPLRPDGTISNTFSFTCLLWQKVKISPSFSFDSSNQLNLLIGYLFNRINDTTSISS